MHKDVHMFIIIFQGGNTMADMNIFPGRPIERISDVGTVRPAGDDRKRGGNPGAFEQMLNDRRKDGSSSNNAGNTAQKTAANTRKHADSAVLNYGFINYYNGKAQSAYFCMTESLMDNKA